MKNNPKHGWQLVCEESSSINSWTLSIVNSKYISERLGTLRDLVRNLIWVRRPSLDSHYFYFKNKSKSTTIYQQQHKRI